MLEVSTSHFNHAQVRSGSLLYMHVHEPSSIYVQETENIFECPLKSNFDHRDVEQHNNIKALSTDSDGCLVKQCDIPVKRLIYPLESHPLAVSSPNSDVNMFGESVNSNYMQKKANRISRIYHDNSSDPFEALEVEPLLLEYLVRHGALTTEAAALILDAEKSDQKAMLLSELGLSNDNALRHSEPDTLPSVSLATGFALLLNALRHTGHHTLASRLDCGRRIKPSPCYQSRSLPSAQRRRGQLSLRIRLDAIKVDPDAYGQLLKYRTSDCVTKGNINGATSTTRQNAFSPMLPSFVSYLAEDQNIMFGSPQCAKQTSRVSTPQTSFWIDLNEPMTMEKEVSILQPSIDEGLLQVPTPEKTPGCFSKLSCVFRPFRKLKLRKRKLKVVIAPHTPVPINKRDENDVGLTRVRLPVLPSDGAGDGPQIDRLSAAKLDLLDKKSSEFCQTVLNSSFPFYDAMVKYFEQSSGVLVLDCILDSGSQPNAEEVTNTDSGSTLRLIVVATRAALVTRLADACQSNSYPLSGELEAHSTRTNKPDPLCGCRVSTDLQRVLTESGIRSELQVQDFRLSVSLDPIEVTKALEELTDVVE